MTDGLLVQAGVHVPLLVHSIELDEPPLVETAANLFKASCYRYREELTAGILVAGWDRRKGGQVTGGLVPLRLTGSWSWIS